jgi:hypothetical protein
LGGNVKVLEEVAAERAAQDAKWGEQNHRDGTGWGTWPENPTWDDLCLGSQEGAELESMARQILEGHPSWVAILMEEVGEALEQSDPVKLRAELVQIAAVAVAWVEAIDRRGAP